MTSRLYLNQGTVVRHQMKPFRCWNAGDTAQSVTIQAVSNDEAEKAAAKKFGVSELRVMSREIR